ncbi:AAA family ATPase [Fibrella aquatilis]|uniref:AAA family ATPase n=1 Tax=Fibrella aquatilis TaxID=2817059 RepID=A0A939G4Z0_9BACT|nr:AAA family ATPase [Fibrella aquatilis]MBO0929883.1 AAA family ATPase [Fibrella aquatilis]
MDHFIDHLEIRNFKSIRELKLTGFKRINLFIGRPNVGKSNLLEAMSVLSLPYIFESDIKFNEVVRVESQFEIFFEAQHVQEGAFIFAGTRDGHINSCNISYNKFDSLIDFHIEYNHQIIQGNHVKILDEYEFTIMVDNESFLLRKNTEKFSFSTIKPYFFKINKDGKIKKWPFLQPPFGNNLLYVLQLIPELRQIYVNWFKQYGLQLVLDATTQSLKIQKDKSNGEVFQLPYTSIADTLQRMIFYKTAVASNENSVLLFEEPEAHAYPPYISEFTQEVIKSKSNQTFIVTHSPLIVEQFLTEAIDDLGIFMVDFKDGQTVVKGLSTDEIREVYKYGMDLFFNGEAYLD